MSGFPAKQQIACYFGQDGRPLNLGYIYFGGVGLNPKTSPVQMYWDAALTIRAAQPFRTVGGFISRTGTPANVFTDQDFSSAVYDSQGQLVYTLPNNVDFQAAGVIAASGVTVVDVGGFYAGTQAEAVLQEIGTTLATLATGNVPTGAMFPYAAATAPAGYVLGSGRTIGNAASGATERNNADTSNLYTLLWNNYANAELPIQDSAGSATTRGASAAADFVAAKRLPLPDYRGRISGGKDDMGGTAANRITAALNFDGTVMGKSGGSAQHTNTLAELFQHTHAQNSHNHIQDGHNHLQNSHNHIQDAHNHIQDAHNHVFNDLGHTHNYQRGTIVTVDNRFAGISVYDAGAALQATGINLTTGYTLTAQTAVNQAIIPTNQAITPTNIVQTATNQAFTAVNQNAGTSTAYSILNPVIISTVIIKL